MTGGLLVALYLFTLAIFLGLDVIRKVPPTLQGALAGGMGAAAALAIAVAPAFVVRFEASIAAILETRMPFRRRQVKPPSAASEPPPGRFCRTRALRVPIMFSSPGRTR